jgi:mannose-6-phosphate isomerase class I
LGLLHPLPLKKGSVACIQAGVVHSTGTGCQLLNIGTASPFFRQHLVSKKTGKRPHLSTPDESSANPLQPLAPASAQPASLENAPYEDHFLELEQLSGGKKLELKDVSQVRAICVVEGTSAWLTYGDGAQYQLLFGQVVLLPARLQKLVWEAPTETTAILITIKA